MPHTHANPRRTWGGRIQPLGRCEWKAGLDGFRGNMDRKGSVHENSMEPSGICILREREAVMPE